MNGEDERVNGKDVRVNGEGVRVNGDRVRTPKTPDSIAGDGRFECEIAEITSRTK